MTPREFIGKWRGNPLRERASYQLHFLDLCELLGVDKPGPDTETYCFERGAMRTGAGQGWADVWKRGCFAIEYKAARRNLGEALKQLMTYALALDNPPLLVVCRCPHSLSAPASAARYCVTSRTAFSTRSRLIQS